MTEALTKSEAVSSLMRAKSRLKALSERTAEMGERTMGAAVTVGVSFATGYAYGRGWGERMFPGTQIPLLAAGGAAALLLGVTGSGGKASDTLAHVGQGIVGADLAIRGSIAGMAARAKAAENSIKPNLAK